ncbi:hypothetical protein LBBP_02681 [Leptospira borgpetersenii serovar Ballum]|uniref:Uncharacterized protein n=1 Tax=Leptospira borgpetersenii serovar Ballum TaxID=280505 RepID=A0A0S2ITC8_LEPBO|nr:hypothetical protein LBBP_02681 [Leptospira borgpetersenii serovar Ballum]OOV42359.1 hypothetical protein B1H38_15375 [Leptospira borgpetersenii serovar Ballum]
MDLKINLSELLQILCETYTPPRFWVEGRGGGKTREVFFTTKSYFLQVKSLILVGTLEKYQFLILMIPKAFLICG